MNKPSFLFLLIIIALAVLGAYHALFPIPAEIAFTRFFALSGFMLICVSLLIGPLATIWPKSFALLIEPRRAVGIAAAAFAFIHILISLGLTFGWNLNVLLGTPGFIVVVPATILLFVLAVTSADYAIKILGPGLWKNVQRFNYLVFILSFAHFILKSNGLFTALQGKTFVNLAEVFCILLGIVTVALQFAGFFTRRKMQAENRAKMAAAGTPPPKESAPPENRQP